MLSLEDLNITLFPHQDEGIAKQMSWDEFRILRAIEVLERKGVARKTTAYKDGTRWYFPGLNLKLAEEKKGQQSVPVKPTPARSTSTR
ncbi:MAG: hypothetical protein GYA24_25585 [Candidatus Lokiarchaeota archaeon]|nr:hypothetical protein [Candidatus Lokiarchaeota archaeon]